MYYYPCFAKRKLKLRRVRDVPKSIQPVRTELGF